MALPFTTEPPLTIPRPPSPRCPHLAAPASSPHTKYLAVVSLARQRVPYLTLKRGSHSPLFTLSFPHDGG